MKLNQLYPILILLFLSITLISLGLYFTKPIVECPEVNENLCSNFIVNCPRIDETLCSNFINECPQSNEKALLTIYSPITEWRWDTPTANSIDLSITDFNIVNYGYTEAKNIEVTCELWELDENENYIDTTPFFTGTKQIGNLASTSVKTFLIEFDGYFTGIISNTPYAIAYCYITDCGDNCEILYERIDAFK